MNDSIFKRIGSVLKNYVDAAKADLQSQIDAIVVPTVSPSIIKTSRIMASLTKVVETYSFETHRSVRLTMQIVDTVTGEIQLQENLVTTDGVNAYDSVVGQMITGTSELVTFTTNYEAPIVSISLTNLTDHTIEVKITTELITV